MTTRTQLVHQYNRFITALQGFIRSAEADNRLGLMELAKANLLHGMKVYEDVCSDHLTDDERYERLRAMCKTCVDLLAGAKDLPEDRPYTMLHLAALEKPKATWKDSDVF